MDSATLAHFRDSQLYKDLEQGLRNLILRKIVTNRSAPNSAEDPKIRFYIYGLPEHDRYACWCTDNPKWACKRGTSCPQQPRAVLGENMCLDVCERRHNNGYHCDDRDCFNPRTKVTTYLRSILKPRPSFSRPAWRDRVGSQVGTFNISPAMYHKFVDAVCLLIADLHDPFTVVNREWNPHVHGIIGWYGRPVERNVDELMHETIKAQTERLEREYMQAKIRAYNAQ
ncbi:hypothetical protein NW754_011931 [Fusarium falciforme]|uniref:Uncharacterized protein n=1 Tax=Fusarium falciforme TaxID=195108 RepID=A0A9W8UZC6_9HYPO|nr:hypothetical protein NW754_011931 [Fusarium falciforme]KAJ4187121.1 hypothetical protein NW755_007215 [Fusarium falciforme]KAJ4250670.1 hypothetical protein NW757_006872 [Fusarium falciforme]